MIATTSNVITIADVDQAQRIALDADRATAEAWQAVETATLAAIAWEAAADQAREQARRLSFQIGFRRVD